MGFEPAKRETIRMSLICNNIIYCRYYCLVFLCYFVVVHIVVGTYIEIIEGNVDHRRYSSRIKAG